MTRRHGLTEAQWEMIRPFVPRRRGPEPTLDDRTFIEAVLYRLRTGIPWRDLPERFGSWKTVYNRFANWSHRGHWEAIFKTLQLDFDEQGVILDASVVRAHQDAAGGKGGSFATRWVVHVVDSPRKSMQSSTRKGVRSTSNSRQDNNMSPHVRCRSSSTRKARP